MSIHHLVRHSAVRTAFGAAALVAATAGAAFAAGGDQQPAPAPQAAASSALGGLPAPGLFDTVSVFAGLDGSKQPQDLGINANMGARFAVNWGFPVADAVGLGAQVGAAVNLSDAAVHVLDQISGTSRRTQTYLTLGMFQRPTARVNWALGYDALIQQYYTDSTLGQVRGQVGYDVTASNEVGVWFTKGVQGDVTQFATTPIALDAISQVNAYTRVTWASQARTTVWVGMANGHHNVVWVFPDNSRKDKVLVYGAELAMPLNDRFAVTGAANFLTPTSTGTVDAYLGVTFFPGRSPTRAAAQKYLPAMVVANSPQFPVNLSR
jgi:hypothetical protein